MIDLKLLLLVENNIVAFNPNNVDDIIKAEKFLKSEAKLSSAITINEIENFIEFFKSNGNKYANFLKNKYISLILDQNEPLNESYFDEDELKAFENFLEINEELTLSFSVDFQDNYWSFIHKNVLTNQWRIIYTFLIISTKLLSLNNKHRLEELLQNKMDLLVNQLGKITQIEDFENHYSFSINPYFYKSLSTLNEAIFRQKIIRSYNYFISQNPSKNILYCKILFSICHFKAETVEMNELFEKMKESYRNKLYFKDRKFHNLYEVKKTKEQEYRSDRNFGIFLILLYFTILFFTYRYIYNHIESIWFYCGIGFIILSTVLAQFKFKDKDQPSFVLFDSNSFFTYKNLKAFIWLTLKGQLLALIIGAFLTVLFFIISIGIAILVYGGIGVLGLVVLFRILKAIFKK